MCGIVGLLSPLVQRWNIDVIASMTRALSHRGPDGNGIWRCDDEGIALGHTRLSILDLSSAGAQPMHSRSGRWVVTFNGEIYNHLDLRGQIKRESNFDEWRGHSDTETILAAAELWGWEETIRRLNGMFAIAVWDRHERTLVLARDRFGEKPLYYGRIGNSIAFASELGALRIHPDWHGTIDRSAVADFITHGYVPAPNCIFKGLRKLPPASSVVIRAKRRGVSPTIEEPKRYWAPPNVFSVNNVEVADEQKDLDTLHEIALAAVKRQMLSDVPIGAFLSGGIDSSLVVSLMQAQSSAAIRTFTVGFEEDEFDESSYAREVARRLGTAHSEVHLSASEAQAVIPNLPTIYDEPFADASQIPTYLIARFASSSVKVCLSGDGGDELFGGYSRHRLFPILVRIWRNAPNPVRQVVAAILVRSPRTLLRLVNAASTRCGLGVVSHGDERLFKVGNAFSTTSIESFYHALCSHCADTESLVGIPGSNVPSQSGTYDQSCLSSWAMLKDLETYLPNDILVKVDRATMACGLESRAPFLDQRLVEYALRLPISMKIRNGRGKWALRALLERYLPGELFSRPKMGFSVPIAQWLRGPLKEWAEDTMSDDRQNQYDFLNREVIQKRWKELLAGNSNWQDHLWDVLMLQAWLSSERRG